MSINVVCDCGKTLKVKDDAAGKKIKCPACQTVLTVPAAGAAEEPPASNVGKKSNAFEDLGGGEDGGEIVKKKKKDSKKKMLIFGAIGGVVLLSCCCTGVGAAVWFFVINAGSPEKVIIGKWQIDVDETKKNLPEGDKKKAEFMLGLMAAMTFEFKDDKTFNMALGGMNNKGKWKVLKTEGKTITLETIEDNAPKKNEPAQMIITVINNDRIKVLDKSEQSGDKGGKDKMPELILKRAK
jgi:phage FluMu protein Com